MSVRRMTVRLADEDLKKTLLYLQCCVLFTLTSAGLLISTWNATPDTMIRPACIGLLLLFLWSLWSWKLANGSLFNPYGLFLIAAGLFNAGQAFLEVFGLNKGEMLFGRFSPLILFQTLCLVGVGLCTLHLGALAAVARTAAWSSGNRPINLSGPRSTVNLRLVGWGLLAISIVPAYFHFWNAVSEVMAYGYNILFQQETVTGVASTPFILSRFLVPGALFLLAGSAKRPNGIGVSLVLIGLYVAVHLFLGSRAPATMALVAYVWLWHRSVRPLPKGLLTSGGILLIGVVLPLVRAVRGVGGQYRMGLSFLVQAFASINDPIISMLSELGYSMCTVAYTLNLVPSVRPYDMGTSYLYAGLTVFPNLFWSIHPTIAHGTLSAWLVRTVAPSVAASGAGLGYSFIAEAYINFGWFGAPVILALLGFLLVRFSQWGERSADPLKLGLVACVLSTVLFYSRSEAATLVRGVAWYAIAPYFLVRLLNRMEAGTDHELVARDGIAKSAGV